MSRRLVFGVYCALMVPSAGCTQSLEPSPCDSDLEIRVAGGAEIRFEWRRGCSFGGQAVREAPLPDPPGSVHPPSR